MTVVHARFPAGASAKTPQGVIVDRPRGFLPCLLAALATMTLAATAGTPPPPLDRPLVLNVWGATLDETRREIFNLTGVEILIYPSDFAESRNTPDIYLVTGRVTLRAVLECLARRLSFRYRVSETGKIEISRSYDWTGDRHVLGIHRLDALTPENGADPAAIRRVLSEFIKPLPLLPGEYGLTLDPYPTPERTVFRGTADLPPVLDDYLERAIKCLSDEAGDHPSPPGDANLFAAAWRPDPRWKSLLLRQVTVPEGGDARAVTALLAEQAGIAVAFAAAPPSAAESPAGTAAGRIGLGQASEEMARRLGMARVFLAAGALVFEKGDPADIEMDGHGREMYWTGLAVAGFDAAGAAERLGDGEALLKLLKREVFPEVWRDPVCGMAYSPVSRRLAAIAPRNVLAALAAKLTEALTASAVESRGGKEPATAGFE